MQPGTRWLRFAAIGGACGILLGTLGAHAWRAQIGGQYDAWQTAVRYLLIHSAALAAVAMPAALGIRLRGTLGAARLWAAGMLLFTLGMCGWAALGTDPAWAWLVRAAPIGGSLLLAGWLWLAVRIAPRQMDPDRNAP